MPNTITDITYGIPAEVWPRDYSKVEASLMFWRKEQIPVKVTMEDGGCSACTFRGRCPPVTR